MLGINYCMEGNYKHRVGDALLERKLLGKGAVLVEGAKWCGKTTTSSRLAKSILKLGETSVLHRRNGTYGLIEIKLGGEGLIEEGAANLKSLAEKIDTTRMKAPSFMMVLTGTGAYAYRRKDGVYVVPIGCLKD